MKAFAIPRQARSGHFMAPRTLKIHPLARGRQFRNYGGLAAFDRGTPSTPIVVISAGTRHTSNRVCGSGSSRRSEECRGSSHTALPAEVRESGGSLSRLRKVSRPQPDRKSVV